MKDMACDAIHTYQNAPTCVYGIRLLLGTL